MGKHCHQWHKNHAGKKQKAAKLHGMETSACDGLMQGLLSRAKAIKKGDRLGGGD